MKHCPRPAQTRCQPCLWSDESGHTWSKKDGPMDRDGQGVLLNLIAPAQFFCFPSAADSIIAEYKNVPKYVQIVQYQCTMEHLLNCCGLGFHLNLEGSDNDMTLTVMVFANVRFALALVFIVCQQPTNSKVRALFWSTPIGVQRSAAQANLNQIRKPCTRTPLYHLASKVCDHIPIFVPTEHNWHGTCYDNGICK